MKILMIDKYFFLKGGSERYMFELMRILRDHGHRVIPFSMDHPRNRPTVYSRFFVRNIEFNVDSAFRKFFNAFRIIGRVLYSVHARCRLERLLRKVRPDIAHLHMIEHQLSPSILHSLKKHRIPVIMTAHQSKMVCPNYRLFNWHKMENCQKCLDRRYYHPFLEKCHKNSRAASLLISLEAMLHSMMKIYEKNIDIIHVPSRFFERLFVKAGLPPSRIEQLYYTIRVDLYEPCYESDNYYLFFGRLEEAKGLMTLLKAVKDIETAELYIVGEGDHRPDLEAYVEHHEMHHVRFCGARYGEELKRILSRTQFVIVPSECYDNSPLVVYESYATGKPVIGSRIGGIPELVDHRKTGLLFDAGDSQALSVCIRELLSHPDRIVQYGKRARSKAERLFSPEVHYEAMTEKYERLIRERRA